MSLDTTDANVATFESLLRGVPLNELNLKVTYSEKDTQLFAVLTGRERTARVDLIEAMILMSATIGINTEPGLIDE